MSDKQAPVSGPIPVARYEDEIDLVEVFQALWQQKWLIAAFTTAATLLAAVFAIVATPTYEASAGLMPPRNSDISVFNLGLSEAGISQFDTAGVYSMVVRNILSDELRREAFERLYLPSLPENEIASARQELFSRFNKMLSVKQSPEKSRPDVYLISVRHENPELAASWVDSYINMAAEKTKKQMQANIESEVAVRRNSADQTISVLQSAAKKLRDDRVVRLREALRVAEAVGLEAPRVTAGKTSTDGDLAEFIDGNLMYMRGAKAIRAELAVLESREDDDPFIGELPLLKNKIMFLERVKFSSSDSAVFVVDNVVEIPQKPIKPKKVLIVTLGFVLGGILGFFVVLIRFMLVKRNAKVV